MQAKSFGHLWYVSRRDGQGVVGPVSAELVARGIVAGRVPRDAIVSRPGDKCWIHVLDAPDITRALRSL